LVKGGPIKKTKGLQVGGGRLLGDCHFKPIFYTSQISGKRGVDVGISKAQFHSLLLFKPETVPGKKKGKGGI